MSDIQPTLKYLESFKVTGLTLQTRNSDEFNEKTAKLPKLWQQFLASALASEAKLFEVYSDFESDAEGLYTVTLGVKDGEREGFSTVIIQAGNYLVFQGSGPMPASVVETWNTIWQYFKTSMEFQRNFLSDFEMYTDVENVEIYIGIN
ncbi:MAG: effector binding domain-containing protein [Tatlockia sp.]|nr:effector binding domain-containing protein [Tatlockia sp.]